MFPQKNRISSVLFTKMIRTGKRFFTPFFKVYYVAAESYACAIVIPKKIIPLRAARNREKRRISHLLKPILSDTKTGKYIFILHRDTADLDTQTLRKEITKVFKKIQN